MNSSTPQHKARRFEEIVKVAGPLQSWSVVCSWTAWVP